jgi:hypothetical protein
VGHLCVPQGQTALLIHTDEHGANGIGPGEYAIHRKRQARIRFEQERADSPGPDTSWVND